LRCYPLRSGGSWDDVCDLADAAWVYCEIIMLSRRCRYVLHARSGAKTIRTHDLYIHPLYVLVSKILSSILNSPAPIHPLYHPLSLYPLWDPLVTLSKYIHVWSSFKGFIETNLMVKSKFNLDFWFVSYSIFSFV
jgi:hypothetical protein